MRRTAESGSAKNEYGSTALNQGKEIRYLASNRKIFIRVKDTYQKKVDSKTRVKKTLYRTGRQIYSEDKMMERRTCSGQVSRMPLIS